MEFPGIGQHCSDFQCKRLDFLPMTCDACRQVYCSKHFRYEQHSCKSSFQKDVQVPVCPLCSEPVPTPPDVSPDITVSKHIDQFCRSERKKIFTNKCSFKSCKKKELIRVECLDCKQNFCLRHRHSADHECLGPKQHQRAKFEQVAIAREQRNATANVRSALQSIQGHMTEDEALAKALAMSMEDQNSVPASSNTETVPRNSKDKCSLS